MVPEGGGGTNVHLEQEWGQHGVVQRAERRGAPILPPLSWAPLAQLAECPLLELSTIPIYPLSPA